jgi:hypothetical protein
MWFFKTNRIKKEMKIKDKIKRLFWKGLIYGKRIGINVDNIFMFGQYNLFWQRW